jgi:hypothetical protein
MKLPSEIWKLNNPFKRLLWAVLYLAVIELEEGGPIVAEDAAMFLTSDEAANYLDLLDVDRELFLCEACELDIGGAT